MAVPSSALAVIIPEVLSKQIDVFATTMSPLVSQTVESSNNVFKPDWGRGAADGSGAQWCVNKTFEVGVAGTYAWAPVSGQTDMAGTATAIANAATATSRVNRYSAQTGAGFGTYPGVGYSVGQSWFRYSITLAKLVGNMALPAEVIRSGNIALADPLQRTIKGTAANLAKGLANAALHETYTAQTNAVRGILGTIAVGGSAGQCAASEWTAGTVRTVTLTGGAIQRFVDGMPVDLWGLASGGTTIYKINAPASYAGPLVVTNVNGLGDAIGLVNLTGVSMRPDTVAGGAAVAGTLLITEPGAIAGTSVDLSSTAPTQHIPWSFDDVLKKTGTIYGADASYTGINVANHPEFQSIVEAINAPIDENVLGNFAARWSYARGLENAIDTYVMSPGVYSGFVQNLNSIVVYEKNGQPLNPAVGYGTVDGAVATFEFEGKRYRFMCDPFMGRGKVYGLKLRDQNWKRYVPPRLKGVSGGPPGFVAGIEFIAPLRGFSDIWEPVNYIPGTATTATVTDGLQAPFHYSVQYVADLVPGIVLTGVTENYATLT